MSACVMESLSVPPITTMTEIIFERVQFKGEVKQVKLARNDNQVTCS